MNGICSIKLPKFTKECKYLKEYWKKRNTLITHYTVLWLYVEVTRIIRKEKCEVLFGYCNKLDFSFYQTKILYTYYTKIL